MKKDLRLFLLMIFSTVISFAQSPKGSVQGIVVEENGNTPIMQATVQLLSLPDSTMVSGNVTNLDGHFVLHALPGQYVLKVSYVGYLPYMKHIRLITTKSKLNAGKIALKTDAILLKEAVIVAEAPQVTMTEDTIGYNASAYRTPQGAMLEELVKKLPGAEVDEDGKVTINGKEVKKIMVGGKEFFGGDVKKGLKNLPVHMIDKVKSYDKRSDLSRITGIDDGEEETVLDLTMKKGMNQGWFGNADMSAGSKDRYMGNAMLNHFKDHAQYTLIASANNVNDQSFSGGNGGGRWKKNNGLNATKSIGFNFATEMEKMEMGGNVSYDYADKDTRSIRQVENFLTHGSSWSNANSANRAKSKDLNLDFRLEWKPDSMTNIIFRPDFRWSSNNSLSRSQSSTFNEDPYLIVPNPNDYLDFGSSSNQSDELDAIRVNAGNNGSMNDSKNINAHATLQVNRKLNDRGRNITFRGGFSYGDNDNESFSNSVTRFYANANIHNVDSVRRFMNTPTNNYRYNAQLTYSEPLAKATFLQFSYKFQYKYDESDKGTYNLPYGWEMADGLPSQFEQEKNDWRDESQSKYAEYKNYNHEVMVALRFVRPKWELSSGITFQPQHTVMSYQKGDYQIDATRNVFNFAPKLDLRIRFSKLSQLRLNYRGRTGQPSMEQLLPIVDDSNPLSIRMGNPGLKPSFDHILTFLYNKHNPTAQSGIMSHVFASYTQNGISNSRSYNTETGAWTSQPKNIDGNWRAFGMLGYNTALPNKKYTINSHTSAYFTNNVGYLTDAKTKMEQKNTTTEMTLKENLKGAYRNDWLEVGVNGSFAYTIEKDKMNSANNQEPYNFSYGATTTINAPWGMSLSTNITNQARRGYSDSSMNKDELIWNAQLAQTFLKGDATISFEMYDILREQSNITRSITSSGRSVYTYNGVNSYCMVHFIYRLNIFGSKEAREKSMKKFDSHRYKYGGYGHGGGYRHHRHSF